MNCQQCRDIVLDLARGVGHPDEAAAREHVAGCAACGHYCHQQQRVTAGLRALTAAAAHERPFPDLEQRVMAAAAARLAMRGLQPTVDAGARTWLRNRWLPMAASLVLAAAAFAAWQWRSPEPRSRAPIVARADGAAATSTSTGLVGAPAGANLVAAKEPDPEKARASASRGSAAPAVVSRRSRPRIVQATGFVPLPAAAMLPRFERGEIVRMRMPLTTLRDYGFGILPDAADDVGVDADVLVAQDGYPRAIRLVSANRNRGAGNE